MKRNPNFHYREIAYSELLGANLETGEIVHFNQDAAYLFRAAMSMSVDEISLDICTAHPHSNKDDVSRHVEQFISEIANARHLIDNREEPTVVKDIYDIKGPLENYAATLCIPVLATIELLKRCHLHCIHCYIPRPIAQEKTHKTRQHTLGLHTHEVKGILQQLRDMGTLIIRFTGGEIFLRKDMVEIIQWASKEGFLIEILTSGTTLNHRQIDTLSRLNVCRLQLSVYSSDPAIHDSITQSEGSLMKTLATAKMSSEAGIPTDFVYVAMQSSFDGLDNLRRLARKYKTNIEISYPITSRTDGNKETLKHQMRRDQLEKLVHEEFDKFEEIKLDEAPLCTAGRGRVAVLSDASVTPCSKFGLRLGDARHDKLYNLWLHSNILRDLRARRRDEIQNGSKCPPIMLCPGENWIEEGDYLRMSQASVEVADIYGGIKGVQNI